MLTKKQIEVVHLLNQGMSRVELAETLNLKPKTIKTYIHSIYKRLNVNSVETLLMEATRLKIIGSYSDINMSIGQALRSYRAINKVLQKTTAKRLNVAASTINKIEANTHKPTAETTFKILKLINPKLIDEINKTVYDVIEKGKAHSEWLEKTNNYKDF